MELQHRLSAADLVAAGMASGVNAAGAVISSQHVTATGSAWVAAAEWAVYCVGPLVRSTLALTATGILTPGTVTAGLISSGYAIVTANGNGLGATVSATATCAAGKFAAGGGCRLTTSVTTTTSFFVENYPASDSSWQCTLRNLDGVDLSITAFAICTVLH